MKPITFLILALSAVSCTEFLEVKPDKKLAVPNSVRDLEALLNNTRTFNISYPGLGEVSAGDFYITSNLWKSIISSSLQDAYIWAEQINYEASRNEWSIPYTKVYNANVIIDAIESGKIKNGTSEEIDNIKGSAHFFRAYAFFNLLQIFAKPWDSETSNKDPGIVLRLTSDFNVKSYRSTVEECYKQVISDTEQAIKLLPEESLNNFLPNKYAAHAFMARVNLSLGIYDSALKNGLIILEKSPQLMDYNSINSIPNFPFSRENSEILVHTLINTNANLYPPNMKVVDELYNLYSDDDLRKITFFKMNSDSTISFRGSYDGTEVFSNSLTTAEIYLIVSECYARTNKIEKAEQYLNILLRNRYRANSPFLTKFSNSEEALDRILKERRRELAFRGLRWTDLRRLNKETKYATTLKRTINNNEYTLLPNSNRYVLPIPHDVVSLTGIEQNKR